MTLRGRETWSAFTIEKARVLSQLAPGNCEICKLNLRIPATKQYIIWLDISMYDVQLVV